MIGIVLALLVTGAAIPIPSATASTCPTTQVEVIKAARPDYPLELGRNTPPFVVEVAVTVNPDGSIKGTKMWQSSGYPAADAATVKAARETTYSPKMVNCKPVEGAWLFRADFAP
jgi:TonB family protein